MASSCETHRHCKTLGWRRLMRYKPYNIWEKFASQLAVIASGQHPQIYQSEVETDCTCNHNRKQNDRFMSLEDLQSIHNLIIGH